MNKFLKVISFVLCLSIFGMAAIASGSSSSDETKKIQFDSDESVDSNDTDIETTQTEESHDITIEEQVILDQDGIVITAQEYVTDSIWGDGIHVLIENNSDIDVTIGCSALIVNNYMITDLFVSTVAAGMRANENIYLSSRQLQAAGIDTVGKIEMYLHAYNADSYDRIFETDCITIETSEYDNMQIISNDDGVELYNENGIRIVGKTVDENSFWGTAILLYIENNSDNNVTVQIDDMAINGFMVSPLFSCEVYTDRMAIDDITIFSSDLEENGITEINEVSVSFHIFNSETYSTITDTDPIVFTAS